MKIKLTHSIVYDTEDKGLWGEYLEYMDDHRLSFSGLEEFLIDRFIVPNFDMSSDYKTIVEIVGE